MDTSGDQFSLYQEQTEVFKVKWKKYAFWTWKEIAHI